MTFIKPLRRIVQLAATLLCLAAGTVAWGQSDPEADPPGRVGRLADLTGQVWMYSPESGEWVDAVRNRPLTTGDRLSTDAGARAELRIGSTTLRLDSGSELEVLRLDDERVSVQLHTGSVAARLRSREAAAEFDVKTDEGRFTIQRAGRYRFDRREATSHMTVYSGQALYEGPRSALTLNAGQRAEFWIGANDAAEYTISEPEGDAFAAWNSGRDRGDDRSVSERYVSPEMTGVEDLDRHGRWEQSQEYGSLWYPRGVAADWAPYSSGRWTWVRPWGWTWVDDAPWGFAPFHYGRWVWHRGAWSWAPGTYVARPIYAPALVAWVGGPSVSLSLSIGNRFGGPAVGWFPLGPREFYVPGYRHSPRYVREVNVTHVPDAGRVLTGPGGQRDFSNRKFPHAVTVVPANVVTQRQPVGPAASQWRNSPAARELVAEPGRHGAQWTAPVGAPAALPSTALRRNGTWPGRVPGTTDAPREATAPLVTGRPGWSRGEGDRDGPRGDRDGSFGDRGAPRGDVEGTRGSGDRHGRGFGPERDGTRDGIRDGSPNLGRPGMVMPAPSDRAVAVPQPRAVPQPVPHGQPQPPTRQIMPVRPIPAEPSARAVVPSTPAPPLQGIPRQAIPQEGRPVGPGFAAPVQPAPRAAQPERSMPERRHHAQPPVHAPVATPPAATPRSPAFSAVPGEAPGRARGEQQRGDERAERRGPRDRSMAN